MKHQFIFCLENQLIVPLSGFKTFHLLFPLVLKFNECSLSLHLVFSNKSVKLLNSFFYLKHWYVTKDIKRKADILSQWKCSLKRKQRFVFSTFETKTFLFFNILTLDFFWVLEKSYLRRNFIIFFDRGDQWLSEFDTHVFSAIEN